MARNPLLSSKPTDAGRNTPNDRSPQSAQPDTIERLQQLAAEIVSDAHRAPREYLRRVDTQQQGE